MSTIKTMDGLGMFHQDCCKRYFSRRVGSLRRACATRAATNGSR
ncbi:hypothetical protein [Bosea sp. F3-2]|nr:hypothetical protein [Bosea sp. F3-2]